MSDPGLAQVDALAAFPALKDAWEIHSPHRAALLKEPPLQSPEIFAAFLSSLQAVVVAGVAAIDAAASASTIQVHTEARDPACEAPVDLL